MKKKLERLIIFIMINLTVWLGTIYTDVLSREFLIVVLNVLVMWAFNTENGTTVADALKVIVMFLKENKMDSITISSVDEDKLEGKL